MQIFWLLACIITALKCFIIVAGSTSRVHFPEDQVDTHNAEISLKYVSRDRVDVHLGFLKINHRYRITFAVKDDIGDKITGDENENIAIFESVPNKEGNYSHR